MDEVRITMFFEGRVFRWPSKNRFEGSGLTGRTDLQGKSRWPEDVSRMNLARMNLARMLVRKVSAGSRPKCREIIGRNKIPAWIGSVPGNH